MSPLPELNCRPRVHVEKGDAQELFQLLVDRKICSWIRDEDVLYGLATSKFCQVCLQLEREPTCLKGKRFSG